LESWLVPVRVRGWTDWGRAQQPASGRASNRSRPASRRP